MIADLKALLKKKVFWIAVLPVLVLSAWLRFTPVNWDYLQLPHPDERYVVWVAETIKLPHSISEFLDPDRSLMNPFRWPPEKGETTGKERDFAYGHFPLYLFAFAPRIVKWLIPHVAGLMPASWRSYLLFVAPHLPELSYIPLVGRPIVAFFDMCSLLLVILTARKLYGDTAGWLAGAFYGLTVMQIQLSHFATTDLIMTFWITWTIFWSIKKLESKSSTPLLLAGAGYGLAVSSKFSASMLILPILTTVWLAHREDGIAAVVKETFTTLLAAAFTFSITSPYAILDYKHYLSNIAYQGAMVRGSIDLPYTRQYIHTLPYFYQGKQLVLWGMGVALGTLSLAAFGGQIWKLFRKKASPAEIVMLAWTIPTALVIGSFHAKFMRYMAPLIPILSVYAAWLAVEGWKQTSKRSKLALGAWALAVIVVLSGTITWAIAFHNIYRTPHTWVQASIWIYEHVPAGSTILNEEWDDSLPLSLSDSGISIRKPQYNQPSIPAYDDDTWEKQEKLINLLREGDYIAIASRRLYKTIGRLPDRYPMMSRYYRLLFDGKLGYEKVVEFRNYPHIGKFVFRDDNADESFVVYDHPHPIIFKKTMALSESELRDLLTPPEWHKGVVWLEKIKTSWRWNRIGERYPPAAALTWWLLVLLMGISAWPVAYTLFPHMRDRGWGFSRLLGWMTIGYGNWIAANTKFVDNSTKLLMATWILLLLLSWLIWKRKKGEILEFLKDKRNLILTEEAIWAGSFILFLTLRLMNPDLWQPWFGGEKFMELAFLHATIRTKHFPPYDPYFAYGIMNYYYYGLYLVGVLSRLGGIFPRVSFNLAIPTLFASTTTSVFSLSYTLASRNKGLSAGMSVLTTAFWGNLAGVKELLDAIKRAKAVHSFSIPYSYWNPSRVIPFTINEFPFWSFLFADLHPHLIAIPFTVLYLALMWEFWAGGASPFLWLTAGFTLGLLAASNTWNLPLAVGFLMLVLGMKILRRGAIFRTVVGAMVILVVGGASYLPFFMAYSPVGSHGIGLAPSGNPFGYWMLVWGLFVLILFGYLLVVSGGKAKQASRSLAFVLISFTSLGSALLLVKSGRSVAAILLFSSILLAWSILTFKSPRRTFTGALMLAAMLTLLGLEFFYVKDFLDGGQWYRMNTLFKFGIQAWVLAGVATGVMIGEIWNVACRGVKVLVEISIALGLVFVIMGTPSRIADRFPGRRPPIGTLDGMAYMSVGEYRWRDHTIKLKYDYEAINWLWDHIADTPTEAEAPLDYYRAGALRVSSFTGFPTLLGQHEPEQRSWSEVLPRRDEANAVFSGDAQTAYDAITNMGVRLIYEGEIERIAYPRSDSAFRKLVKEGKLEVVYENRGVTIYRTR